MSGTSLDGVDAAMVRTDGHQIFEFGRSGYRKYSDAQKELIRAALGSWPGEAGVEEAAEAVETAHAVLLSGFAEAEIVGFHGQTLAHEPETKRTHQAGDGALMAEILQKPVVWDFRTADVQLGGQGAPLAPFFHHAAARYLDLREPIAFLNMGGVGNITFVNPRIDDPCEEGALLAFDTGPANAPINDLVHRRTGKDFDEDGEFGSVGKISLDIAKSFLSDAYFNRMPPKSLDRNAFTSLLPAVENLLLQDAAATLTECSVRAVARAMEFAPKGVSHMLVTGGGRHNSFMMERLADVMPIAVTDIDETGLDGDMLEAQAFAYLAVRVSRGLPTSCPSTTGVKAAVGGGSVSYPKDEKQASG